MDWSAWHDDYDRPDSSLRQRLAVVQEHLRAALDAAPAGPIRVLSMCAGQGRDVIEVLADHPRRADVTARLVELDPRNVAFARDLASGLPGVEVREADAAPTDHYAGLPGVEVREGDAAPTDHYAGLPGVEVREGDAALTDHYEDLVPAEIVLMCGVFGNISDADVERTAGFAAGLCARDGTLIWTRHRNPPDLFPTVCEWFERQGFERVWVSEPDAGFGVGVHRLAVAPRPLPAGERMFTFVGYKALAQ